MSTSRISRVESAVAFVLTAACLWLYVIAIRSAGALWRDEANTVGVSTLPRIRDVWENLQYDSFPLLWMLLVRGAARVFGEMNDPAFRLTGLVIGMLLIAAFWFSARAFSYSFPLVSLTFLGLNPSVVRWATSLRGYGLGMAIGLVTGACIWQYIRSPSRRRFIAATISAVAGVQVLYYNAPVLLSFCAGGIVVATINRRPKIAAAVFGIGAIAAASLLPYIHVFRQAATWNSLVRIPSYGFAWFAFKLGETISPTGLFLPLCWSALIVLAVFIGFRSIARPRNTDERNVAVFALVSLAVGAISIYVFLKTLSYVTQPWYYLALLLVIGSCAEMLTARLIVSHKARVIRVGIISLVAVVGIMKSSPAARVRLTNVDVVAERLESHSKRDDFILIDDWPVGVTFDRYFRGPARWTTVPPFGFHHFHNYNLVRSAMEEPNQRDVAASITAEIEKTLKTGGSVFILRNIGHAITVSSEILGPATLPKDGWLLPQYQMQWSGIVEQFLNQHAARVATATNVDLRISHYENIQVVKAEGWKP